MKESGVVIILNCMLIINIILVILLLLLLVQIHNCQFDDILTGGLTNCKMIRQILIYLLYFIIQYYICKGL